MGRKKHAPVACDHRWEEVKSSGTPPKLYGWFCIRCKCNRPARDCLQCFSTYGAARELEDPFCSDGCRDAWVKANPTKTVPKLKH